MKQTDLALPIQTPEGSTLILRPAGIAVRGAAWALDALARATVYTVCAIPLGLLGRTGFAVLMLLLFAGEWLYFAGYEAFRSGATPGKRRMGIKVVQSDGGPVSIEAALVRNLVRFADTLPFAYGAGLVSCLSSSTFQRLGDRVAGTLVVHVPQDATNSSLTLATRLTDITQRRAQGRAQRAQDEQAENSPEPERPAASLTGHEAALLLSFEERRARLHPDRQIELANLLEPLTGQRGEQALATLRANAHWLEGEA